MPCYSTVTSCPVEYITSAIPHGFAPNCTDGNNIGSWCKFSCEETFSLSDHYIRKCNADAENTYWAADAELGGMRELPFCIGKKHMN